MKVLVLNDELGISTNEPFEVLRTVNFYVIEVDGVEVLVETGDVEELNSEEEDEG